MERRPSFLLDDRTRSYSCVSSIRPHSFDPSVCGRTPAGINTGPGSSGSLLYERENVSLHLLCIFLDVGQLTPTQKGDTLFSTDPGAAGGRGVSSDANEMFRAVPEDKIPLSTLDRS